ncbi:MAG: transposase [Clostridia bacterium]|nr:transposase [Clostridia bacterium]
MDFSPKRKHNRLTGYDYSSNGIYHIVICSNSHRKIFSTIEQPDSGKPVVFLTSIGETIEHSVNSIDSHYDLIKVLKYVIMPNHIHLLLQIENDDGRQVVAPTISTVIMQLKRVSSKTAGMSLWQKGFYDHIIKNEKDFENVCVYIEENPAKWENDEYY